MLTKKSCPLWCTMKKILLWNQGCVRVGKTPRFFPFFSLSTFKKLCSCVYFLFIGHDSYFKSALQCQVWLNNKVIYKKKSLKSENPPKITSKRVLFQMVSKVFFWPGLYVSGVPGWRGAFGRGCIRRRVSLNLHLLLLLFLQTGVKHYH